MFSFKTLFSETKIQKIAHSNEKIILKFAKQLRIRKKTVYLPIIMKIKILPIISALFLVVAMAIQSAVSYNREKNSVVNLIENRMELAQKNLIYEVYDMYEVTDEISLTMNHGPLPSQTMVLRLTPRHAPRWTQIKSWQNARLADRE